MRGSPLLGVIPSLDVKAAPYDGSHIHPGNVSTRLLEGTLLQASASAQRLVIGGKDTYIVGSDVVARLILELRRNLIAEIDQIVRDEHARLVRIEGTLGSGDTTNPSAAATSSATASPSERISLAVDEMLISGFSSSGFVFVANPDLPRTVTGQLDIARAFKDALGGDSIDFEMLDPGKNSSLLEFQP